MILKLSYQLTELRNTPATRNNYYLAAVSAQMCSAHTCTCALTGKANTLPVVMLLLLQVHLNISWV